MSLVSDFISKVQSIQQTGIATEHSYRSAFEGLFSAVEAGVTALNEPKRVACGAPDFIISKDEIVVGHLEAKDLHIPISGMKGDNKAQQERYKAALPNLIYTNGLDWDFYRDGELLASVTIADFLMDVIPKPDQYESLENLLCDFIAQRPQTITSPQDLAVRMAGKANLVKDVLRKTLDDDEGLQPELLAQYQAFKENLIHDITPEDFADIYAETIAYGMFAARLHDTTLDTFSRQEALELLPKSNPFLRSLFGYVAGHDLDDRIAWIIDDLALVFKACDVAKLMEGFGKLTGRSDPFLHFYETFLAAYNPAKRKARGVWYTPEPVVNFIVRAVDGVLQNEFGLPDGLADTSKITIDWDTGQTNKRGKAITIKKEVHRVQILDPATGTGTFLAEVIKQIAPKIRGTAPGMWSQYIEQDVIPRLHGFELLMASYAMCHMKLDMTLTELGYKPTGNPPRLGVYLTNSLEEGEPANQTLPFTQWLSREAKGANTIKRDMPIMCVIGNPPYSGESSNKGNWILSLMDAYKKEPGGKEKLKEKNPKWINKDEHKFIRMAEHLIENTGEGVLGFISSHGYLDDPTIRGMRWHLLSNFDRIYILDLHGNSNKKEISPDGSADKNVFDIKQGVSIIIAVKKKIPKKKGDLAKVYHQDAWGKREEKYDFLWSSKTSDSSWEEITPQPSGYYLRPFNYDLAKIYEASPSLADWFSPNGAPAPGIVTTHDQFAISWTDDEASTKVRTLLASADEADARKSFKLCSQKQWQYHRAKNELSILDWPALVTGVNYRPFDKRSTVFNSNVAVHLRHRMTHHFFEKSNIGLITSRMTKGENFAHVLSTTILSEAIFLSPKTGNNAFNFPLYLYPSEQDLDQNRRINLDPKLWKQLQKVAQHPTHGTPDEIQTYDYIYGVLHCPAYRETYAELLKIDFPRIPWPATPDEFWDISTKGTHLRKLHLMDPATIGPAPYQFTGEGDGTVEKPRFADGKVWINPTQYFDGAPEVSWTFYIGGYQPAQKWLKDRKGRMLTFEDVKHYQRIIKILSETDRIMKTITMSLAAKDLSLSPEDLPMLSK